MNRMHVISIPYSLMKVNPLSWIQKVHTYKGKYQSYSELYINMCHGIVCCFFFQLPNRLSSALNRLLIVSFSVSYTARVAVVKSRDMHWSLLAQRDQKDISLSSVRMLIVADGANPCEFIFKFLFRKSKLNNLLPDDLMFMCGCLCVCVCVLSQGRYPPVMPSSTCSRHVG